MGRVFRATVIASTARLLMDAATRTAFHFLISNLGGGGSSFFSSAAGPSLVSMADMGLPEVRANGATAVSDALRDSAMQLCDAPVTRAVAAPP